MKLLIYVTSIILFFSCSQTIKNDASSKIQKRDTIYSNDPEICSDVDDTLHELSNDTKLLIKRYCLKNKGFKMPFNHEQGTNIIYFHDYAVNIKVENNDKIIFTETLQKEDFAKYIDDHNFLSQATIGYSSFNNYDENTSEIKIRIMISKIETDYAFEFEITIDSEGKKEVKLIEVT